MDSMFFERKLSSWGDRALFRGPSFFGDFRASLKDNLRKAIGWWLEKTNAPAKMRLFEVVDPESNETVYLYTSNSYSVLCVGDRRFYFDRITGKFDGVSSPSQLSVAGGLKFSD